LRKRLFYGYGTGRAREANVQQLWWKGGNSATAAALPISVNVSAAALPINVNVSAA